jgi:hypothetical protein
LSEQRILREPNGHPLTDKEKLGGRTREATVYPIFTFMERNVIANGSIQP